jgi:hypothetical protein
MLDPGRKKSESGGKNLPDPKNWQLVNKQKNSAHLLALGSENPKLLRECLLLLGGLNTAPHRQHS